VHSSYCDCVNTVQTSEAVLSKEHSLPGMALASLLPLRMLVVTLQARQRVRPAFFHQPALLAFIRFLAGSPEHFDQYLRIDALESGRVDYAAGDYYRFLLIGLSGSDTLLDSILLGLSQLPHSAPKTGAQLSFSDNWHVACIHDAFTEQVVHTLSQVSQYSWQQLQDEATLWQQQQRFEWRWLSPARLLKAKATTAPSKNQTSKPMALKASQRPTQNQFCRDLPDLDSSLLLCRVYDAIANLLRRRGHKVTPRPQPPPAEIATGHCFWLDAEYRSKQRKQATEMGGLSGQLSITLNTPLSHHWWQRLILGQYLGIGQNTSFGWGRYQLQTVQGLVSYRRALPATSLLYKAQSESNLSSAWRHVMRGIRNEAWIQEFDDENHTTSNTQEDEASYQELTQSDEASTAPLERLNKDFNRLLEGQYKPPLLRGHVIPKSNGKVRALAIPPAYDRVLQRAVVQILTPALEQLMDKHSHGYRRGRSRLTARYDIQAAWRAGYHWVFESDIKDFFDSVNLDHLNCRLRALFGDDPIVNAIIGWMQADVQYQDQTIQRHHGLPQGSPLSPLMANLMLDDFDNDMRAAGFHLIRFADDFIVLCKSPSTAQAADEAARRSLAEHGLQLNEDKTQVTHMGDGFNYLGYLFVNDLALDVGGLKQSGLKETTTNTSPSWLAQLGEREAIAINNESDLAYIERQITQGKSLHIGERDQQGTLLTVTGEHSVLSTFNKNLQVVRKEQVVHRIPWQHLQAVIVFGNHQITTQAMRAAMQHHVPIHLSNAAGRYYGVVSSNQATQGERLWLQQIQCNNDEDKALYCAREIVRARLIHMKETLRHRQQAHKLTSLSKAIRDIGRCSGLASLRGMEGAATREYYQRIALILPHEFNFSGRNRRPPKDPFNVLLSLGYTLLYGYTQSIIHTTGLLPRQGFYHQAHGQHAALASDLMEPFRHLVERVAMTALLRQDLQSTDFTQHPSGSCHIAPEARRKFMALLLRQWQRQSKARGDDTSYSYISHLHRQALSYKAFIQEGSAFKAWRMR